LKTPRPPSTRSSTTCSTATADAPHSSVNRASRTEAESRPI
jgi:hypothetical protein